MTYTYAPEGVCSSRMTIELENGVVTDLQVERGCNGNLQGISRLVIGLPAEEVIRRLSGIHCGGKGTSCPDQLAKGLALALAESKGRKSDG